MILGSLYFKSKNKKYQSQTLRRKQPKQTNGLQKSQQQPQIKVWGKSWGFKGFQNTIYILLFLQEQIYNIPDSNFFAEQPVCVIAGLKGSHWAKVAQVVRFQPNSNPAL